MLSLTIRNDGWGQGIYFASRDNGTRKHGGLDIQVPDQPVLIRPPLPFIVMRSAIADSKHGLLGFVLQYLDPTVRRMRYWKVIYAYLLPEMQETVLYPAFTAVGQTQPAELRSMYPEHPKLGKMKAHIHLEDRSDADRGIAGTRDPLPLLESLAFTL